ncbi:hypothetical protein PAXRUDRAFT_28262 [Paxillus rubicundulus Ve08.2h10]|uniref:Uncharacterized protein n=1 Tax=Paxillus rubicundulus Ve08.2h10 TaxID=930991 RepID=A0A0D0DNA5_9AGAM|nr:hypothetical protein PAXRUDRAFT_28262 [Paxillus rubicundulus Ve08.2h10]
MSEPGPQKYLAVQLFNSLRSNFTAIMSSPAQSDSEPDADTDTSLISNGSTGKTRTKETKSTKVKEAGVPDDDGSKEEEGHNGDDSSDNIMGAGSDLERSIAHFWWLIIKQWGNEYDNSVTYLHPTGVEIPYWAIAMHEGTATKLQPPNIQSFDPQKCAVALIPTRHLHMPTPATMGITSTPSSIEISALMSALLLQTAQGLCRDQNGTPTGPGTAPIVTPTVSAVAPTTTVTQASSPAVPTPSKLTQFLEYADTQLGVQHASTYEAALRRLGAGPDILAEMSDSNLSQAGLNPGDIICLKCGATVWWNGPDAK